LPAVSVVKDKDGSVIANVNVAANKADLSQHYNMVRKELFQSHLASKEPSSKEKPPVSASVARQKQEDDYRGFRTKLILLYMGTNAALFFTAISLVQTDIYLVIVLGSVALLQGVKLLGVVCFLGMRLWTEVLGFGNDGKKRLESEGLLGGGARGNFGGEGGDHERFAWKVKEDQSDLEASYAGRGHNGMYVREGMLGVPGQGHGDDVRASVLVDQDEHMRRSMASY
jgi:hypothetical protein